MTTILLVSPFSRYANPYGGGEIIDYGNRYIYWTGVGSIQLDRTIVDDKVTFTTPYGTFSAQYTSCGGDILHELGPFDITNLFRAGTTTLNTKIQDVCGIQIGTNGVSISGNIQDTVDYRDASLVSCQWPSTIIVNQSTQVTITVNQGSLAEDYKLVYSGDYIGESTPFTITAGTGQLQFIVNNITFILGGSKTVTTTLIKMSTLAITGTCTNTIDVCVPTWQCEPGLTGFEIDGCGNRRANSACLPKGSLSFSSNPPGAQIFLSPTGQTPIDTTLATPNTIENLPIGGYDYVIKLTNYNDYISPQPVAVLADQIVIISTINLIPSAGCIFFNSDPPGASIFLNGTIDTVIDTGFVTPKLICGLTLRDHAYKLSLSNYQDITGTITLGDGHGEIISTVLVQYGAVTFITIPSGAEIWLAPAGQPLVDRGVTTSPTGTTIINLLPGDYDYELTLTGYQDSTGGVTITTGQITILPPITLSLLTGGVTITSTPPGASIYIDDVPQGTTPNTILGYSPGPHTYKLTLTGYQDKTDNFDITDGLTTTISVTLGPVVVQEGFGAAGAILLAGLAIGFLLFPIKEKAKTAKIAYLKKDKYRR